ncbi:MAG: zinc-finger family protein [Verrucomicrobiales bacterium]|nr:zinc-finger family protein [Verrucomicrobiales bacterium]
MNCQQAKPIVEAYADGALEAAMIMELERHLHDCPACAQALRNVQSLKKALQQDAHYFAAPTELRRRVKAELNSKSELKSRSSMWNWLTAATTGMATACLALLLVVSLGRPSAEQRLTQEIVSSHVRSLMADHVLDVVSTDQHTVKPWFNGKLDFSPPVKDLAAKEFPLIGGRLDYLGGRNVAALIFRRQKHVINLFIWPTKEKNSEPALITSSQGYHLIHWSEVGMVFWAVSDLNEKELMEFVQDYEIRPD